MDNDQLQNQPHTVSGRPEAYGRTKAYVLGIISASLSSVLRLVAYAGWDFSDTTQSPGRLHKFVPDMECFKSMGICSLTSWPLSLEGSGQNTSPT
jgi:hypothetical protein